MRNLFFLTINPLTERVLDEGLDVARTKEADKELSKKVIDSEHKIHMVNKKRVYWILGTFLMHILAFYIAIIILICLQGKNGIDIRTPMLVAMIAIFGSYIATASLLLLFYKRKEEVELKKQLANTQSELYSSLNVPREAQKVDALFDVWTHKGRKARYYRNYELLAYKQGENLCFASKSSVYSVPISSIKKISVSDELEHFSGWNREESFEDEMYRDSIKIKYDRNHRVRFTYMKNSHHVEIELNGEKYKIIIPKYDFMKFEKIYREF